jgi:16S rRNA (cytosine1402-N4)-methyltransferase
MFRHTPVLLKEVVEGLCLQPNQNVIDATVGGGGHAEAILAKTGPAGKLLGIDADPAAIAAARKQLTRFGSRVTLVRAMFFPLEPHVRQWFPTTPIHAILFDLGLSSYQLQDRTRGFSFQDAAQNTPLDMAFGPEGEEKLPHLLATASSEELAAILRDYGEERNARAIARQIVHDRRSVPFTTTGQLLATIRTAYRGKYPKTIHFATQSFQALRIAVNDELTQLRLVLPEAINLLQPQGRLAVISFHSLEDRIVKHFFQRESRDCVCPPEIPECRCAHHASLQIITKKPITAGPHERQKNSRARSAKLRFAERKKGPQ